MRSALLFFIISVGTADAFAQQACSEHPVLEIYESARDGSVPRMDQLGQDEADILKGIYGILESAAIDGASEVSGNPVPVELLTNMGNFRKIIQGDSLEGGLGIYGSIVGKLSPTLGKALPNMWRQAVAALSGEGASYGEREDQKNRMQTEQALSASGCSGGLSLPRYVKPTPPGTPPYISVDFCDGLDLTALQAAAPIETSREGGRGADDYFCNALSGNHTIDPTQVIDFWGTVHIFPTAESAESHYDDSRAFAELFGGAESRVPFKEKAFGGESRPGEHWSMYLDGNAIVEIRVSAATDAFFLIPQHGYVAAQMFMASRVPNE